MNSPPPENDADLPAGRPLRVLVVVPQNVIPANHGKGVRVFNLFRQLSGTCEFDVLIFHGGSDDPAQREALAPYCRRVLLEPFASADEALVADGLPREVRPYAAARSVERLRDLVRRECFDLVQFENWELGALVLPDLASPAVVVAHDLGFVATSRNAGIAPSPAKPREVRRELDRQARFERGLYRRAASIHCMSRSDAETLARRFPESADRIAVVPNGVDTGSHRPEDASRTQDLLFLGSFPHLPNRDAVRYLVREIWPRLRKLRPATRLTLAGASPDAEILALGAVEGVTVAGELADIRSALSTHRILVSPIRSGSGTRLKILDAFAAGLPVISTTLGAEGLGATPGEHLVIADDPRSFAEETARLLDDEVRRQALAESARSYVVERFDWARSAVVAEADYALVAKRFPRGPRRLSRIDLGANEGDEPPIEKPDIDLVVFGEPANRDFVPLLDALAEQESYKVRAMREVDGVLAEKIVDATVRLNFVISDRQIQDLSAADPPAIRAYSFEPEPGYGWPAAVNDVLGDLTAPVLLLLNAALLPSGCDWLANLSWSLFQKSSPAVVFGAIERGTEAGVPPTEKLANSDRSDSPPRPLRTGRPRRAALQATSAARDAQIDPFAPWTEELEELGRRAGGRLLDVRNCGFLRRFWEDFPIPERGLSGAIWQMQLTRFGTLVHFVETAPARELTPPPRFPRALLSEANAFARLGRPLDWRRAKAAARELGLPSRRERWKALAALYLGARLPSHRVDRYARHQLY